MALSFMNFTRWMLFLDKKPQLCNKSGVFFSYSHRSCYFHKIKGRYFAWDSSVKNPIKTFLYSR